MIFSLPPVALLVITLLTCLVAAYVRNRFSKWETTTPTDLYFFQFVTSLVGTAVVLAAGGGFSRVTLFSLIGGLGFGALIAVQGVFSSLALSRGPFSYTTIIEMLSTVIPAFAGMLFFGQDPIDAFQYVGIALLLLCFFFAVERKQGEKKGTVLWLFFTMMAFFGNGFIGVLQTLQGYQRDPAESDALIHGDITAFLFFSFLFSTVFALVMWLGSCARHKIRPRFNYGWKGWLFMGISAVFCGLNHIINLFLVGSALFPTIVFFPIVNGGHLLLTTLLALFVDGERPKPKQWVGFALGVLSLLLLCLFNTKGVFQGIF